MKQLGLPMSSDVSVYKPEREPKGIQLGHRERGWIWEHLGERGMNE